MSLYNVINRTLMQAGQLEDISQVVANFDAIAAVLNGNIDNSNINAGAAIDYSKIAVPAGAIPASKVSGLSVRDASQTISAANTDLTLASAAASQVFIDAPVTGTAGTVRSLATGGFLGQQVILRHSGVAGTRFILKNQLAGGTGAQFVLGFGKDYYMGAWDSVTLQWNGTYWLEIARDENKPTGMWNGSGNVIANAWQGLPITTQEAISDGGGFLSFGGTVVTINKPGWYHFSVAANYTNVPTVAAVGVQLGGAAYAINSMYGTFGEPLATSRIHYISVVGTQFQGVIWQNWGTQNINARIALAYLGP